MGDDAKKWDRVRERLVANGWQRVVVGKEEGVQHPGDGTTIVVADILDPIRNEAMVVSLGRQIRGLHHKPSTNMPLGWHENVLKTFQELLDAVTAVNDEKE